MGASVWKGLIKYSSYLTIFQQTLLQPVPSIIYIVMLKLEKERIKEVRELQEEPLFKALLPFSFSFL